MRLFLVRMAVFWLIQAGIFAALYAVYTRRTDNYLAASLDKEHRLATLSGPRVVLVGGSNLAFGIDSSVIERCTGRHSINMGLHAELGVAFMLDEVRAGLRPGDVVILALEYHLYVNELLQSGTRQQKKLLQVNPWAAHRASAKTGRHLLGTLSGWLKGFARVVWEDDLVAFSHVVHEAIQPGNLGPDAIYARHQFNEAGDVKMHREPLSKMVDASSLAGANFVLVARATTQVEAFVQECRQRGIAVYLAAPVFPRPDYESQRQVVEQIQSMVCHSVSAPLLVAADEATLPRDRFFDTSYHLTSKGAVERSRLLGLRLAEALAARQQPPATKKVENRPPGVIPSGT